MPAMCMRFWPEWRWLKDKFDSGEFGEVRSAVFTRRSPKPDWSTEFYLDMNRSGGALFDLHIHDADFVTWIFGPPDRVTATGSAAHVSTIYHYQNGPKLVSAEGGWLGASEYPFLMAYTVEFDECVVDFQFDRTPSLVMHTEQERGRAPKVPEPGAYVGQLRAMIDAINDEELRNALPTLQEALLVTRLIETEAESASQRKTLPFEP